MSNTVTLFSQHFCRSWPTPCPNIKEHYQGHNLNNGRGVLQNRSEFGCGIFVIPLSYLILRSPPPHLAWLEFCDPSHTRAAPRTLPTYIALSVIAMIDFRILQWDYTCHTSLLFVKYMKLFIEKVVSGQVGRVARFGPCGLPASRGGLTWRALV